MTSPAKLAQVTEGDKAPKTQTPENSDCRVFRRKHHEIPGRVHASFSSLEFREHPKEKPASASRTTGLWSAVRGQPANCVRLDSRANFSPLRYVARHPGGGGEGWAGQSPTAR